MSKQYYSGRTKETAFAYIEKNSVVAQRKTYLHIVWLPPTQFYARAKYNEDSSQSSWHQSCKWTKVCWQNGRLNQQSMAGHSTCHDTIYGDGDQISVFHCIPNKNCNIKNSQSWSITGC